MRFIEVFIVEIGRRGREGERENECGHATVKEESKEPGYLRNGHIMGLSDSVCKYKISHQLAFAYHYVF